MPQIARVVRSAVISVRERDYVEAERALLGASNTRIVSSAILPNSLAPLIVQATPTLATAIPDVAALSFLGLGTRAPTPEWGAMLTDAFRSGFGVLVQGQRAIIFPGIAIALPVLPVNFIGDAACATPWIPAGGARPRRDAPDGGSSPGPRYRKTRIYLPRLGRYQMTKSCFSESDVA